MSGALHLTSGDCAGGNLAQAGLPGEILVWHDILYEGPRGPGWPDEDTLRARALFLERATAGGLDRARVLAVLRRQYQVLADAASRPLVLWFDACLFDQSMLAHVLACLYGRGILTADLLCVEAFPGIELFHGLGQLAPAQLASLYETRRPVTEAQFRFAVRAGRNKPGEIFAAVSAADTPPQFWGDTTLWAKLNALADRTPPRVRIEGPAARLPQWESPIDLQEFTITAADEPADCRP